MTIAGAPADLQVTPTTLTFTAANWKVDQRVQVAATADADHVWDDTAKLTLTTAGAEEYHNVSAMLTVTVEDDDVDALTAAWMGRFGRTVAEQVLDAVAARVNAREERTRVVFGGADLPLFTAPPAAEEAEEEAAAAAGGGRLGARSGAGLGRRRAARRRPAVCRPRRGAARQCGDAESGAAGSGRRAGAVGAWRAVRLRRQRGDGHAGWRRDDRTGGRRLCR